MRDNAAALWLSKFRLRSGVGRLCAGGSRTAVMMIDSRGAHVRRWARRPRAALVLGRIGWARGSRLMGVTCPGRIVIVLVRAGVCSPFLADAADRADLASRDKIVSLFILRNCPPERAGRAAGAWLTAAFYLRPSTRKEKLQAILAKKREQQWTPFLMGTHGRLGDQSLVGGLDADLARLVCRFV